MPPCLRAGRPSSPLGGTSRRQNNLKKKIGPPLPEPDLHPLSHARPLPHKPSAFIADCASPPRGRVTHRPRPPGGGGGDRLRAGPGRGTERSRPVGGKWVEEGTGGGEEAGAALPWGRRWLQATEGGSRSVAALIKGHGWAAAVAAGGHGVGLCAVPGAGGRCPPGPAGAATALAAGRRRPHAAVGRVAGEEAR